MLYYLRGRMLTSSGMIFLGTLTWVLTPAAPGAFVKVSNLAGEDCLLSVSRRTDCLLPAWFRLRRVRVPHD